MKKSIKKWIVGVFVGLCAALTCSACAESEPTACVHSYGEWQTVAEADCVSRGVDGRECALCGEEDYRFMPAFGHTQGDWVVTVESTCETHGHRYRECTVCHATTAEETLDKLPHTQGDWIVEVESTCETHGHRHRECTVCHTTIGEEVLDRIPHTQGDWIVAREASCTEKGYRYRECTACYQKLTGETLAATGHTRVRQTTVYNGAEREYYICENCDYSTYGDLEKGHIFHGSSQCIYCEEDFGMSAYRSDYGYRDLGKLANGESLQAFYRAMDNEMMFIHANPWDVDESNFIAIALDYQAHGLTSDEAISVWKTYGLDNPLYYWRDNEVGYSDDTLYIKIESAYANGESRAEMNRTVEEKIAKYLDFVEGVDHPYDIALAFHDEILRNTKYAYDENGQPQSADWAHSILGTLTKGEAVCEGYAELFQLLLTARGVPSILVSGTANTTEPHLWNLIALDDGNWYWCDLTWDDLETSRYGGGWGIGYRYFCVNDTQNVLGKDDGWGSNQKGSFLQNHTPDSSQKQGIDYLYTLPVRNTQEYSYRYKVRSLMETGEDVYAIAGYRTAQLVKSSRSGEVVVPEQITYDGVDYTVISVGTILENGLYGNNGYSLFTGDPTSVRLPKTIVYVWDNQFRTRKNTVAAITVDEANPYFTDREGVLYTKSLYTLIAYPEAYPAQSYVMPDETVFVTKNAISGNQNLQSLTVGKNLSNISVFGYKDSAVPQWDISGFLGNGWGYLLDYCPNLTTFVIPEENPAYVLEDEVIYNKNKTELRCVVNREITTLRIPDSVRSLDSSEVFSKLTCLEEFIVGENNEYFSAKDGILYDKAQTKLFAVPQTIRGEVTVADGVTVIGRRVFGGCDQITRIVLPDSVLTLEGYAFSKCTSLESIVLSKNITKIDDHAFAGLYALKEIQLHEGITEIGEYAFLSCTSLETLVIPDSVVTIGVGAFNSCRALKKLVIPAEVERLENRLFTYSGIERVFIPASVNYIDEYALEDCDHLTEIYFGGTEEEWTALTDGKSLPAGVTAFFEATSIED